MLTGRGLVDGPDAVVEPDVATVAVRGEDGRQPLQVAGDLVGEVEQVRFTAVPNAIRVVADPAAWRS